MGHMCSACGAVDLQLRQKRRKFYTFNTQNSTFYIFESRLSAASLITPTRHDITIGADALFLYALFLNRNGAKQN